MEMWYGTNSIHMWTMPILGSALLSLYVFLTVREQDTVALEILGTIKSFSIWEAADCLCHIRCSSFLILRSGACFFSFFPEIPLMDHKSIECGKNNKQQTKDNSSS